RRSVLVLDVGAPRNAAAGHVHNFLTRDGVPPGKLLEIGRDEVRRYGGRVERGEVTALHCDGDQFRIEVDGCHVGARQVLLATGVTDELPDIPGLAERWGVDVLHCPHCHGWEVRDRRVGILSTGPFTAHAATLFRALSNQITVLDHVGPASTAEQREQFDALGIRVVAGEVTQVESGSDGMTGVRLADGTTVGLDALVVTPRVHARVQPLAALGIEAVEVEVGSHCVGELVKVDATGATSQPGVWAAGNVTDIQSQVISSAASGLVVGAAINATLIAEDTERAVREHRYERVYGEAAWDERYASHTHIWSGSPNPVLVAEVAGLSPGTALDAGAGEGADACWLAATGWKVTGVELSSVALERAAQHATERGLEVTWRHIDLSAHPAPRSYDLVSAFFLHLPVESRRSLLEHLAAAVAPGGTLLIVGHHPSDGKVFPRPTLAETSWTPEEIALSLDDGWTIEVAEARPRRVPHPEDGHEVIIHDAVLRARRNRHNTEAA
ncbi:MAG: NAD(P)/FAD-dependent oxidoreductase, partial [Actinomycetota bacterium]|nr:NAD(P)/FAD-dependent oxidoreductase [Actinomycetota bacterium]